MLRDSYRVVKYRKFFKYELNTHNNNNKISKTFALTLILYTCEIGLTAIALNSTFGTCRNAFETCICISSFSCELTFILFAERMLKVSGNISRFEKL